MNTLTSRVLFLFIHGMWERPACWDYVIERLETRDFMCFPLHLLHHYEGVDISKTNLGTTSLLDYVENLEIQIADIRVRFPKHNIILVGHSMGGLLAQMLMSRTPEVFSGGILFTPAPPAGIWSLRLSTLRCFSEELFKWGCWRKPFLLSREKFIYAMYENVDKTRREEIISHLQKESGRAAFEIGFWQLDLIARIFSGKGFRPAAAVDFSLNKKLLFVGAEKDTITPASVVRKTARMYPNARYEEIKNASHFILENEDTVEIILRFMQDPRQTIPALLEKPLPLGLTPLPAA